MSPDNFLVDFQQFVVADLRDRLARTERALDKATGENIRELRARLDRTEAALAEADHALLVIQYDTATRRRTARELDRDCRALALGAAAAIARIEA